MNARTLLVTSLLLGTTAVAQTYVVAPDNAAVTQPGTSTLAWRDSTTGFRTQLIYDTTHFINLGVTGPCTINRMRFRAANANVSVGGSYPGDGLTTGITLDIGTSTTDYFTPSTTFLTNRGTMQNVMTFGTVNVAAGAGLTPNNYVIDIAIPGGFAYDPSLGQDLLIDITGPDFIGTMPTLSTGSSGVTHRCSRLNNVPSSSTTSTAASFGFAPVVLFDITGPGGLPDNGSGFPVLTQSTSTSYGIACAQSTAFAEFFPFGAGSTLDLGTSITLTPNTPGAPTSYTVTPGSTNYYPRGATPLLSNLTTPGQMTDDSTSVACTLPFSFPFVGGSTTTIHANTNGYIVLAPTTVTGGDASATLNDLVGVTTGTHSTLPRLAPIWYDFHAARNTTTNPGAGIYFDVDTVNNKAYVTWENVGEFATSIAGTKTFNFQVELSSDGTVEYRYGAMGTFGSASATLGNKIVGFSPGVGAAAPVSIDLSASMPYVTMTANYAAIVLSSTAPKIGSTLVLTSANVPAPGILLNWISTTQVNPGIDLSALGITGGCSAFVDLNSSVYDSTAVGVGSVPINVPLPFDNFLVGLNVYSQSAALNPLFNAFGVQTSNGLSLRLGNVF